jgi:hypothetical protein
MNYAMIEHDEMVMMNLMICVCLILIRMLFIIDVTSVYNIHLVYPYVCKSEIYIT